MSENKMSLFNFYLDDKDKENAIEKLGLLFGEQNKGMLSAFIRVAVKNFANTPIEETPFELIKQICDEFTYSQKKNKRSRL